MKAKFGAIVVDGRGKIGGHVASKNRGGSYFRTKVTPANPQTTSQNAVRSRITSLSQRWKSLTETQRAAWNGAVSNYSGTNIFGDAVSPSGLNLFVKLNANLLEIGGSVITTPPLPDSVFAITAMSGSASAGGGTMDIVFGPSPVPANTSMIIKMTPQVSAGKSFLKNLHRNVQIVATTGSTPVDVFANYIAKFGALVVGQKVGVTVTPVSTVTGIKGGTVSATFIITA